MKHKVNYAAADAGFTALVNLKSRLKKWLAFDKQLLHKMFIRHFGSFSYNQQ